MVQGGRGDGVLGEAVERLAVVKYRRMALSHREGEGGFRGW